MLGRIPSDVKPDAVTVIVERRVDVGDHAGAARFANIYGTPLSLRDSCGDGPTDDR
jgi:hypothetical protein